MASKLLVFVLISAPHIWALPVPAPGTFDYHDVNYVNLENTFMSKPAYDYAVPYQVHPNSFQNAHLPTYLRQEMPTYHILKSEYPAHLYPLHTVFFITAGTSQNQGIRPQTLQQRFDYPDVEYDQSQSQAEAQQEPPKFHVQPQTSEFHVQPEEPKFHVQPEEPKFHVQPEQTEFQAQPEEPKFHVVPEFNAQPMEPKFHVVPEFDAQPPKFHVQFNNPEEPKFHVQPVFHVQPEMPSLHLQPPPMEQMPVVREDNPVLPMLPEADDEPQTGNMEPEENKSMETAPEVPIMKMEPEDSNLNVKDRFGSDSNEAPKMPLDIPPPMLIAIDNEKVNSKSGEMKEFPATAFSGEVKVNAPAEIPPIPLHFQPLQNSAVQTHEAVQEEEDEVVSKSENQSLNREDAMPSDISITPVQSESGSSEQEQAGAAATAAPEAVGKEKEAGNGLDDDVPVTTESNGTEVDDSVQTQNIKIVEFEATTETAETSST